MNFNNQIVLPAISNYKDLRLFTKSDLEYCIIIDFQLAELVHVIDELKESNKKVLIHIELIKGLANDEYGAIHLIQNFNIDGLISTKSQVIQIAKKRKVLAIQRIFLKDSISLERSLKIVEKANPDLLEILPAISGEILKTIKAQVSSDIICGGLLLSKPQIANCIESGAVCVTTSNPALWDYSHTS